MLTIRLRCYEELNEYLPAEKRKRWFEYALETPAAVGDVLTALGIPLDQVDLVLADGVPVDFSHRVSGDEAFSIYPVFEAFDISSLTPLAGRPLRETKFVLDVHLGRLARYLRMLGFDCRYGHRMDDHTLAVVSREEGRVLLSRDHELLRRRELTHAYCVRSSTPRAQAIEVVHRFDLTAVLHPFTRCLHCNTKVEPVSKADAASHVDAKIIERYDAFTHCPACGRIYWKGTHQQRMQRIIEEIQNAARRLAE